MEGMASAIDGKLLEYVNNSVNESKKIEMNSFTADSELEFGYCTEFILQLQNSKVDISNFDLEVITNFLEEIGDSIVAFKDNDIVKVHVHTFTPGKVITYCQQFGEYVTFKMENMSVMHSETTTFKEEKTFKDITYVAVANGDGICELFEELGVDVVVKGGQTMNPSTEDFIKAFDSLNTNNIIVFPNNSNIIMAAKQAAANYSKANVAVIETKSIAECYSALSMADELPLEELFETFNTAIENVNSLEVTYAVRDTQIDEFDIIKGDYLGFIDHKLKAVNKSKIDVVLDLLGSLDNIEEKEVLTIFFGSDVSCEEISELIDQINSKFDWFEVGSIEGKQDIYCFIISVE
jgi:DAK2 domain fusion protein YloV